MKMKEICIKYEIANVVDFERFIREKGFKYSETIFGGTVIDDDLVEEYVNAFKIKEFEIKEEEAKVLHEKVEYNNKISTLQKTTGYNFEGYKITQYLDLVTGATVLGTGFLSELSAEINDLLGTPSDLFSDKLHQAKEYAQSKMVTNAVNIGANAIIGIDFDYITFAKNMIGVTATGTAVIIEKE